MTQRQLTTSPEDDRIIEEALLQSELISLCEEYEKLTKDIDKELGNLPIDTAELNAVAKEMEEIVAMESAALALAEKLAPEKRYSIAGDTRLRWLLDGQGAPIIEKLDQEVSNRYRRMLMQHYHPDRETGDTVKFNLVQLAVNTANVEMLALLALGIGHKVDVDDLRRYHGAAYRRMAKLKAGLSFKALCLCKTGNKSTATLLVQSEIDKRTNLLRVSILMRKKSTPK